MKKRWTVVTHLPPDLLGTVSPEGMYQITQYEKKIEELFETLLAISRKKPREFWVSENDGHYEIHTTDEKALCCSTTVFKVVEEL